jgi:hypothetical protein
MDEPLPDLVWEDEHTEIWEYPPVNPNDNPHWVAIKYDHYQVRFDTREEVYESLGVRIKEREKRNAQN